MKRKIGLAALALATFVMQSFASGNPAVSRKIENNQAFGKIIVGENLNVMLVDEEATTIIVEGKADLLNSIEVSNKYGVLTISSKNNATASGVMVYVPVKSLYNLEIGDNSKVYSPDIIKADDLKVLLNGECKIGLQTTGKITLQYVEELEFTLTKVKNPKMLKTEIFLKRASTEALFNYPKSSVGLFCNIFSIFSITSGVNLFATSNAFKFS